VTTAYSLVHRLTADIYEGNLQKKHINRTHRKQFRGWSDASKEGTRKRLRIIARHMWF